MRNLGSMEVASVLGSLFILFGSFYVSYTIGDPYFVRRGGALLVIYSLLFAFRAHVLDETIESLERGPNTMAVASYDRPTRKLLGEVDEDVRHYRRLKVMLTVSRVFRVHLAMAAVGEVMHGFGDLIYIQLFGTVVRAH